MVEFTVKRPFIACTPTVHGAKSHGSELKCIKETSPEWPT